MSRLAFCPDWGSVLIVVLSRLVFCPYRCSVQIYALSWLVVISWLVFWLTFCPDWCSVLIAYCHGCRSVRIVVLSGLTFCPDWRSGVFCRDWHSVLIGCSVVIGILSWFAVLSWLVFCPYWRSLLIGVLSWLAFCPDWHSVLLLYCYVSTSNVKWRLCFVTVMLGAATLSSNTPPPSTSSPANIGRHSYLHPYKRPLSFLSGPTSRIFLVRPP